MVTPDYFGDAMTQSAGPTDSPRSALVPRSPLVPRSALVPKAESPAAAIDGIERLDELDLTVVEPATIFHVAESDG